MGDYATCVTEPFWKSHLPDAWAYFVKDGWTEVGGEKNAVSFCKIFRDLPVGGIHAQIICAVLDLEEFVDDDRVDLRLSLIDDSGAITPFSLSTVRADRIAAQQKRRQREEYERVIRERVIRERIQRDMAADNGVPNPEIDAFLDASPKPTLTVEAWSEATSEAWRLRQK